MTDALSIRTREPRPSGWGMALSLMTMLQILGTSCVLALTALAPVVAADLGIAAHWIGYQISLIYCAGIFASAFAGALVAAIGTRHVILVETALFGLGLILLASGVLWLMVAGSLCFGIGYGLNNPASSEILQKVVPHARRNLIFSIKQSGVPVGAIVASLFLPALVVAVGGNWRWGLLSYTGTTVAMFAALAMILPRMQRHRTWMAPGQILASLIEDQRYILRRADQRALALIGGLFSACQLMVTAFTILTLVAQGWPPVAAGSIGAAMHAAGAGGRIFWGGVADKVGSFPVLGLIGLVIAGLSVCIVGLAAFPPAAQAAIFVALGFVASGWNGVMLAGIAQTAPDGRVGSNTGAALVYTFLGVIIGPSVFASLYGVTGAYTFCFGLVTAAALTGAALAFATQRNTKG